MTLLPYLSGALGAVIGSCIPRIPFYLGAEPPDPDVAHGPAYVGITLGAAGAFAGLILDGPAGRRLARRWGDGEDDIDGGEGAEDTTGSSGTPRW